MKYRVSTPAAAPPEDVWRLFVDVEHWPDMTKSLRAVQRVDSGPFQVGSEAVIRATGCFHRSKMARLAKMLDKLQ